MNWYKKKLSSKVDKKPQDKLVMQKNFDGSTSLILTKEVEGVIHIDRMEVSSDVKWEIK